MLFSARQLPATAVALFKRNNIARAVLPASYAPRQDSCRGKPPAVPKLAARLRQAYAAGCGALKKVISLRDTKYILTIYFLQFI